MLTAKDILKNKVKLKEIEFNGDKLLVKEFTPLIRQAFINAESFVEQQQLVIAECLHDEKGNKLFSEEQKEELKEVSPDVLDELFTKIMEVATGGDERETAGN